MVSVARLCLAGFFAFLGAAWGEGEVPVATTTHGPVRGTVEDGIYAFKGLRYGAAPIGPLRFKPPQAPAAWNDVAPANAFGAPAIQMATGATANPTTELSKQLATVFTTSTEMKIASEDCLFLNVWTPGIADERDRPVMVWLHGGGFAYGSGSWPVYDGRNLADKGDVVVVTVNHRLNVFGYLYLGELAGEAYAQSGNAGMLDLVAALEWVHHNISAFGGDPGNVTIFGESGGGVKVSVLMAMPAAQGLFHKAVIQSGPGIRSTPKEAATEIAKAILDELGIDPTDAKALQGPSSEEWLQAAFAGLARVADPADRVMRLAPVVDGIVLPSHPFDPEAPSISKDIPVLVGWNKDEMTLFNASESWFGTVDEPALAGRLEALFGDKGGAVLAALRELHPDYSPTYLMSKAITSSGMFIGSVTLAERKAAQKGAPVYMYSLVWETPVGGGIFKSPHTLEIPFVFDNVELARPLVGPGAEPENLQEQMSNAWLAFARSGDPNAEGLPEWPTYDATDRATMIFDLESRVVNDPDGKLREILQD